MNAESKVLQLDPSNAYKSEQVTSRDTDEQCAASMGADRAQGIHLAVG